MKELVTDVRVPIMFADNQPAIRVASASGPRGRTKLVAVKDKYTFTLVEKARERIVTSRMITEAEEGNER